MRKNTFTLCLILIATCAQLYAKPKAHAVVRDSKAIHFSSAALEKAYYRYIAKPGSKQAVSSRSIQSTLSRLTGRRTDNVDSGLVVPLNSSNLSYSGDRGGDDNTQSMKQDYDQQTNVFYVGDTWVDSTRTLQSFDANNNIDTSIAQQYSSNGWVNYTLSISTFDNNNHITSFNSLYWKANAWVPTTRYLYTYSTQGYILENTTLSYTGDSFATFATDTFTYDVNNRLIRSVEDLASNDTLGYNNETVYSYDNNGNIIYDAHFDWSDSGWVYAYRDSNTFNSSNNPLTELNQSYYPLSVGWFDNYLHVYTYDAHQNNLTYIEYIWNDSLVPDYGQVLTYNTNNDTLTGIYFALYNNGIYDTSDRILYTYTYNGSAISSYTVLDSSWDSTGVYSPSALITYNFDANGNIILYESQSWNSGTNTWGNSGDMETAFLFNSYNQYVTENDYDWGTTTWEAIDNKYWWYQTYEEGIPAVPVDLATSVSPNPFTHTFTLAFDAAGAGQATLKLYDLNGRLLTTNTTTAYAGSNTIVWDAGYPLPAGMYIYELWLGNAVSRGKVASE